MRVQEHGCRANLDMLPCGTRLLRGSGSLGPRFSPHSLSLAGCQLFRAMSCSCVALPTAWHWRHVLCMSVLGVRTHRWPGVGHRQLEGPGCQRCSADWQHHPGRGPFGANALQAHVRAACQVLKSQSLRHLIVDLSGFQALSRSDWQV